MQLIGMMDSPFVRRVGITMHMMGFEYESRPLSIFQAWDEFRTIMPMVKVPTLVCDDGEMLVDSSLIITYLEQLAAPEKSLVPSTTGELRSALQVIAIGLVAMEKVAQLIYETKKRPADVQYQPWIDRLDQQLSSAVEMLEQKVGDGQYWLSGENVCQSDITTAVTWRFIQHVFPGKVRESDYPGLVAFSRRAERLPAFMACPLD